MGSRGGAGVEIDVSLVPQRETGMTPYEIMLSESQERMLLVVKRGREAEVERIFEKWDLHAVRIGKVTADGLLRVKDRGPVVAEIPNRALTDEAPVYERPMAPPDYLAAAQALELDALGPAPAPRRRAAGAARLADDRQQALGVPAVRPHGADQHGRACPGLGAGVVRIKGTDRALAMSVDGNGRYGYLDPVSGRRAGRGRGGAQRRVRRGAKPLGGTNCLNFGNPERPAIMWQFAKAVEGIGAACRALDVPITGGNCQLYNETDGKAIYPTPDHRRRRAAGARGPRAWRGASRPTATPSCCSARAAASWAAASISKVDARAGAGRRRRRSISHAERALQDLLVALAARAA